MNQLTNDGTFAYTYDDNGNLIQKADGYNTFIYTYDYENGMTEVKWNGVTIQENFYDCCGKRIKMKNYNENGELMYTTIYIYIGWNTIYEKTIYPDQTVTETEYIYGASGHMAKITDTGTVETTTFYHTDVLGSVRQKTDINGNSLWASYAIYKPFGGLYSGGPSDESETHLYTGKTYDFGTGLYYYGARFYDPEVGRFVTKDLVPPKLQNPQSLNSYTYCYNNPLKYVDPNGLDPWDIIAGALIGVSGALTVLLGLDVMSGILTSTLLDIIMGVAAEGGAAGVVGEMITAIAGASAMEILIGIGLILLGVAMIDIAIQIIETGSVEGGLAAFIDQLIDLLENAEELGLPEEVVEELIALLEKAKKELLGEEEEGPEEELPSPQESPEPTTSGGAQDKCSSVSAREQGPVIC